MKKIFTLITLSVSVYSNAQTLCGTASEGGTVNLTAPPGNTILSIDFASYGTPNGSCGSFTIGGCHAANSQSICQTAFVGHNSASINATNGVFGDPCGGTLKRLYVQVTYSNVLPLNLASFTAKKIEEHKVRLDWLSDHETNASHFVIERSTDGVLFEVAGSVAASGSGGHNYSFTDIIAGNTSTYYYRLKMVDIDSKTRNSNIVRINNSIADLRLSLFPNPANKSITVLSNKRQDALITNNTGQLIKKIILINGNQTLNIASWASGVYFIKTEEGVMQFIKE